MFTVDNTETQGSHSISECLAWFFCCRKLRNGGEGTDGNFSPNNGAGANVVQNLHVGVSVTSPQQRAYESMPDNSEGSSQTPTDNYAMDIYDMEENGNTSCDTFESKCDFESRTTVSEWGEEGNAVYREEVHVFTRGERFIVLDISDIDLWQIMSVRTQKHGYASADKLVKVKDFKREAWFAPGVSRAKAEHALGNEDSIVGSFLIRKSETYGGGYTLSVRIQEDWGHGKVKHCRIQEKGKFYLTPNVKFKNLSELVRHYAGHLESDIGTKLKRPCLTGEETQKKMEDVKIDRRWLTFAEKIADQYNATVHKGTWHQTVDVAIKKELKKTESDGAFMREAKIRLRLGDHDNIVKFYGVVTEPPRCIVTAYYAENLQNYLRANNTSLQQHTFWITGILDGMSYMESKRCVHRNLRASNVLVGHGMICKISGFGFARFDEDLINPPVDRPSFYTKWTAPEALAFQRYSIKSDVWSFGITCIEIATNGAEPYSGAPDQEIAKSVHEGNTMQKPAECPQDLFEFVVECWEKEPGRRPRFADLKRTFDNGDRNEEED